MNLNHQLNRKEERLVFISPDKKQDGKTVGKAWIQENGGLKGNCLIFSEIEAVRQKLVFSRYVDSNEKNLNLKESIKQDKENRAQQMKETGIEERDYFKEDTELIKVSNYPHYKKNFVKKESIHESHCVNTDINRITQEARIVIKETDSIVIGMSSPNDILSPDKNEKRRKCNEILSEDGGFRLSELKEEEMFLESGKREEDKRK